MSTILVSLGLISALISLLSYKLAKNNQFYSDVPLPLLLSGIYVWGDGLVLGPFWLVSILLWYFLAYSPTQVFRYFLLFLVIRSAYEIIYWLQHQMLKKDYIPPLFRRIKWLTAEQHGILYQLLHTVIIVLAISIYLYTLEIN